MGIVSVEQFLDETLSVIDSTVRKALTLLSSIQLHRIILTIKLLHF